MNSDGGKRLESVTNRETRVASRQIKLAFSSFAALFWKEENLK